MNKLLYEKLLISYQQNEIIQIYTDKNNPNNSAVGFVKMFSQNELLLNAIDPNGFDDGYIIFKIEDIFEITYATNYLKSIKDIHKNDNTRSLLNMKTGWVNDSNLLVCCLTQLLDGKKIVTIESYYEFIIHGIVFSISDNLLEIKMIDELGGSDGSAIVAVEDILSVSFDGKIEKKIFKLCNRNSNEIISEKTGI